MARTESQPLLGIGFALGSVCGGLKFGFLVYHSRREQGDSLVITLLLVTFLSI